jgi:hypothetical protein
MRIENSIDLCPRTHSIDRRTLTRNYQSIEFVVKTIALQKICSHFHIDRKNEVNLIKILGEDGIYYSTLEYIPEYHVYVVFGQI